MILKIFSLLILCSFGICQFPVPIYTIFFPSGDPGRYQDTFPVPYSSRVQQSPGDYQQQSPQNYGPQPNLNDNNSQRRQGQPTPTPAERQEASSTNSFKRISPSTAAPNRQNFNQHNGNGITSENPSFNTEDQRFENNPSRPSNKPQFSNVQPFFGPQNSPSTHNRGSAENGSRPSGIPPNFNQFANRPTEGQQRPQGSEEQPYGINQNGRPGNQGQSQFGGQNYNRRPPPPFSSEVPSRPTPVRPTYQQGSSEETGNVKFGDYKPVSKFAWQLFQVSNNPQKMNLVMCPLSPQLLLSYLAYGSDGSTKNEIVNAISYGGPRQVEQLMRSMLSEPGNRELQFATAFFIANNAQLNPRFKSNDAIEVIQTDFTQPQQFQNTYNRWVSSKTKGALSPIQAQPNPSTRMILSSAVYFKGGWIYKFNPAQPGTFYNVNDQPTSVPMMTLRKKLPYGSVRDMCDWVSIPYNSTDSMVVMKPRHPYKIDQVIQNLNPDDVNEIMEGLHRDNYANVNLTMPKFKADSTTNLVKPLQQMGINKAFSRNSEITKLSNEPLQVSTAVQQASMEVNEEGSVATSLTSFSVVALSFSPPVPNIEFNVDRPFIAMIVNRDQKFPYFVAKICAP